MAKNDDSRDHKMSAQEAGRMGGEATRDSHGEEFYSEIGSQQGKDNNPGNFANRSEDDVKDAASRGGQARSSDNDSDQAA